MLLSNSLEPSSACVKKESHLTDSNFFTILGSLSLKFICLIALCQKLTLKFTIFKGVAFLM